MLDIDDLNELEREDLRLINDQTQAMYEWASSINEKPHKHSGGRVLIPADEMDRLKRQEYFDKGIILQGRM